MARGLEEYLGGARAPAKKKRKRKDPPATVDPILETLQAALAEAEARHTGLLLRPDKSWDEQSLTFRAAADVWLWQAQIHRHLKQYDFAKKATANAKDCISSADLLAKANQQDRLAALEERVARSRNSSSRLAGLKKVGET